MTQNYCNFNSNRPQRSDDICQRQQAKSVQWKSTRRPNKDFNSWPGITEECEFLTRLLPMILNTLAVERFRVVHTSSTWAASWMLPMDNLVFCLKLKLTTQWSVQEGTLVQTPLEITLERRYLGKKHLLSGSCLIRPTTSFQILKITILKPILCAQRSR